MAINPTLQFPGQIKAATPAFPYGEARDIVVTGDNTGTPWVAVLLNDIFGFQQALLDLAGIVPSNVSEEVGASQYLDSLIATFTRKSVLTARELGLTGAGDETVALQAAIDLAADKSFYIDDDLDITISGIITVASSMTILGRGTISTVATKAFEITSGGTILRDFTIDNDVADVITAADCIVFNDVSNCRVDNLVIVNSYITDYAIKILNCGKVNVTNCELRNNRGGGVFLQGTVAGKNKNNKVLHNHIEKTGAHGIRCTKEATTTDTGNIISNNSVTQVGANSSAFLCTGIKVVGDGDIIEGNSVRGQLDIAKPQAESFIGISVVSDQIHTIVNANKVDLFVQYGVEVSNGADNCNVQCNVISNIFDDDVAPSGPGAALAYTGGAGSKNNQFNGNNVSACFKGYEGLNGSVASIVGNMFFSNLFNRASINTRGINLENPNTLTLVSGNYLEGWDVGFLAEESVIADDVSMLSGNVFNKCNWGVRTVKKGVNVTGNHFQECGVLNTSASIGLESESKWLVSSNTFDHTVAGNLAIVVKPDATGHGGISMGNRLLSNTSLSGNGIAGWFDVDKRDGQLLSGADDDGKLITYGTAIPVSGTYTRGDIIFDSTPSAGSFIGFVCTASGTPGTWKTWGVISA